MKVRILFYSFFLLCLTSACKHEKMAINNPNFLFILADDLGYNDLGIMGSSFYETPNIDRIANNGIVFTNGYANCAVCSPSRASIMTGRYPTIHGITDYIGAPTGESWRKQKRHTKLLPPGYQNHLGFEFITLPELMRENGYKTFFAGKWHLGSEEEKSLPTDHGFDVNKGGYHRGGPYSGGYFSPFNNPFLMDYENEKGMSLSMKLARETSTFIKENRDSSFFAYLSFYAVHSPIQTSKAKWEKYRNKADSMGIHENGFAMERILPARKYQDNPVYAGLIEQMDDALGYIIQTLEELDLAKNTIIIFSSDNGGVVSGDNFSTSLAPLRGGKGYQWEGGIKVPYFIYVPGMKTPKKKISTPVLGLDLYPTILDLAGIEADPGIELDGISLLALLKGDDIASRNLYWHYPHYGNQGGEPSSILLKEHWKLIHYWEDGRDELYNLQTDIGEKNNLSSQEQERVSSMRTILYSWLDSTNATYPKIDSLYDELKEQKVLEANGKTVLHRWEKLRKEMLKSDWMPNEDWWGSEVYMD